MEIRQMQYLIAAVETNKTGMLGDKYSGLFFGIAMSQFLCSKNYLKTLDKYYVVDIGLRYMLLGSKNTNTGHILENIIYLELIRRGYKVYVGKVENEEVDFVAMNRKGTIYYQVAASVRNESTLERELRPLQKISDYYPKYILTLDEDPNADYDGIRRINALDFLLGE